MHIDEPSVFCFYFKRTSRSKIRIIILFRQQCGTHFQHLFLRKECKTFIILSISGLDGQPCHLVLQSVLFKELRNHVRVIILPERNSRIDALLIQRIAFKRLIDFLKRDDIRFDPCNSLHELNLFDTHMFLFKRMGVECENLHDFIPPAANR